MRAGFAASSLPGSRVHSSCEWCAQCIYPIYTLYDVHIHAVKQDAAIWKMPATRATGCSGLADARGSRRRGGVCESPLALLALRARALRFAQLYEERLREAFRRPLPASAAGPRDHRHAMQIRRDRIHPASNLAVGIEIRVSTEGLQLVVGEGPCPSLDTLQPA